MKSCFKNVKEGDIVVVPCDKNGWWDSLPNTHFMKMRLTKREGFLGLHISTSPEEDYKFGWQWFDDPDNEWARNHVVKIIRRTARDAKGVPLREIVPAP